MWALRSPFFYALHDTFSPSSPTLSQSHPFVATTSTRIWLISWNQPKIPLPLLSLRQAAPQQSKASFDCIRLALSLHQFHTFVLGYWLFGNVSYELARGSLRSEPFCYSNPTPLHYFQYNDYFI